MISPVTLSQIVFRISALRISSLVLLHMSSQWFRATFDASKLITMQNTFNEPLTIMRQVSLPLKSMTSTNSKQCGLQMQLGMKWTWLQSGIAGRRPVIFPCLLAPQFWIQASLSHHFSMLTTSKTQLHMLRSSLIMLSVCYTPPPILAKLTGFQLFWPDSNWNPALPPCTCTRGVELSKIRIKNYICVSLPIIVLLPSFPATIFIPNPTLVVLPSCPIFPLTLAPLSTPQAMAHGNSRGCYHDWHWPHWYWVMFALPVPLLTFMLLIPTLMFMLLIPTFTFPVPLLTFALLIPPLAFMLLIPSGHHQLWWCSCDGGVMLWHVWLGMEGDGLLGLIPGLWGTVGHVVGHCGLSFQDSWGEVSPQHSW